MKLFTTNGKEVERMSKEPDTSYLVETAKEPRRVKRNGILITQ